MKKLVPEARKEKGGVMLPIYTAAVSGVAAVLALIALMLIPRRHDRRKDDKR